MNKFLTLFLFSLFTYQSCSANFLLRRENGDLSPARRHLSQAGQLNLKIDGRGYFMYRLRVKTADASEANSDGSQVAASADGQYHEAYRNNVATADKMPDTDVVVPTSEIAAQAAGAGTFVIASTDTSRLVLNDVILVVAKTDKVCAAAGEYSIRTAGDTAQEAVAVNEAVPAQAVDDECTITEVNKPAANPSANAGLPDASGENGASVENAADGDSENFSQVVYSRDGSLHVNKYGYLCDDNGLLLVSEGKSRDANAKFHIHVPSRAENILVTPSGKLLAEELGGSVFTNIGQLKLARFENPQGLNVRLHMKSNCAAANEDGFALGNWCVGTALDGKDHVYMSETAVSGPGIVGKPGDQGLGRIVV